MWLKVSVIFLKIGALYNIFPPKVILKSTASNILEKAKGNFCEGVGYKLQAASIKFCKKRSWNQKLSWYFGKD